MQGETGRSDCPVGVSVRACLINGHRRAQPTVGSSIPRQVVLDWIKELVKELEKWLRG